MAERADSWTWAGLKRPFTMRALWRLAVWGTAAAVSLLIAVLAGFSESGSRRMMAARAAPDSTLPAQPSAAQLSREVEIERRQLAESMRSIAADRDQLAARVETLERSLEDVTGSIKRQGAIAAAAADSPAAAASVPAGAAPAPAASAAPKAAAVASSVQASPKEADLVEEPASVAPADATGDELLAIKGAFGVDLGGATSFEKLRALWSSANSLHAALFEGLYPVVAARETSRHKPVELRLIVGPLANKKAAAGLCAALAAARQHCRPVSFEGKRLAQAEPERKAAAVRSSAPAAKPGKLWPFR